MRQIFWIILFCLAFENALTDLDPERRNRLGKVIKFMKVIKEINERKLRKLEGTDDSDSESGSNGTYIPPNETAFDNVTNSDPNTAEVGEAIAANGQVPANKPVSTTQPKSNDKKKSVQILKFHSFGVDGTKISFGSFFYFIKRVIPYGIYLRLRVTYPSGLRNLQSDNLADSLRTECIIDKDYGDQAGVETSGNINYNCNAEATKNAENANVTLNTDYDLMFYDKDGNKIDTIGFEDISMNGNSSQEAANLQDNRQTVLEFGTLKTSSAEGDSSTLTIKGTPDPTDTLTGVSDIKMDLVDENDAVKQYDCEVSTESSKQVLKCDASRQSIKTNTDKLHLSTGYAESKKLLLTVEMDDPRTSDTVEAGSSNNPTYYRSSSSGLSGGAIAGIVIACVAALIAAAVAAIMLRKPSPPIDNTTVAELKTDNI